jgi:hypothetical protein
MKIELEAVTEVHAAAARTVCSIDAARGDALYGVTTMKQIGEDAMTDILYRAAYVVLLQQAAVMQAERVGQAAREQIQREALEATENADEAAKAGAMLVNILKAPRAPRQLQIERTGNGWYIVNKLGRGLTLSDAFEGYYRRAILRERPTGE